MRFRLTPRDTRFFDLLAKASGNLVEAAGLLVELIDAPRPRRAEISEQIRVIEHRGDEATHEILRKLNSTFVTPFDRGDIYALAGALDDCLDEMEAAADLIVLYRIDELPAGVAEQVRILRRQAELTAEAMPGLRSLKGLEGYWVEINRLENEADRVYRQLLAALFDNGTDAIEVLKIKEVIDLLESAADAFETLSHHVETIAVKES